MKNVGYALRALAGGLTAILTTTCAHAQASVTISEAKAAIMAARASAWKDPGSIQDAQISPPESCIGGLMHILSAPHTCVCIMTNARNSFGGYTGLRGNVFLFSGKKVVDIIEPRSQDCHGPMTAWPEFNGRSR
jgi:hypothetical protein